jgi:HNH endonuclease
MRRTTPLLDRLIARIDAEGPCWEWTGAISSSTGYGAIGRGRRGEGSVTTHQAMWEQLIGPVPDGLELDHLCRNRSCCNPDHLQPVTRIVNVARGARRPGYRDHITRCSRGHAYDGRGGRQRRCSTCHREDAAASNARKRVS